MVKSPRIKHSKTRGEPVTIDLDPQDVSREPAASPEAGTEGPIAEGGMTAADAAETPVDEFHEQSPQEAEANRTTDEQAAPAEAYSSSAETLEQPPQPEDETVAAGADPEPVATPGDPLESASAGGETASAPPFGRSDPERPQASAPPARSRGWTALAAGLAGGVAALALAAALQWAGVLGGAGAGDQEAENLRAEIASLRQEVAASPAAADPEELAALAATVEQLRAEVQAFAPAADGVDAAALEERLAALEQGIAAAGQAQTPEAALAGIEERLASLETAAGDQGLEQRVAALEGAAVDPALENRVAALEAQLGAVSQQVEEQAGQPATALIIAASALKAAIDRGQPFQAELETYAALAPDSPQLQELRELAAAGVPTRAEIAAAASQAADRIAQADRVTPPDASIWDRLMASAQDVVVVRPVGEVEGEGPPAVAARIEAAVQAEDYSRALAEFDTLPPEAQLAGSEFITMVRNRQRVDELVDQALSAALDQA